MRISTIPGDQDYRADAANFAVFLDDELMQGSTVIAANEEKGEVDCFRFDERGNIVHDGKDIIIYRLCGRVEVRPVDACASAKIAQLSA
jgi:hypothetical protein